VAVAPSEADQLMADAKAAGIPALKLGTVGGANLNLPGESPISVAELKQAHEGWLPNYMAATVGN